ncbi:MAG: hypothetical protein ACI30K_00945 [Muribaculaceae bacterium]
MKKKRITYGVIGLMEYQTVVKIGHSRVKVHFADGTVSAMGVNPATFTTDNIMVQIAIEGCADYKRGLIKRLKVVELDDEIIIERNSVVSAPTVIASSEVAETKPVAADDMATDEQEAAPQVLEFTCNDDAKDYLVDKYGVESSRLRTRAAIIEVGRNQGVEIVFTK